MNIHASQLTPERKCTLIIMPTFHTLGYKLHLLTRYLLEIFIFSVSTLSSLMINYYFARKKEIRRDIINVIKLYFTTHDIRTALTVFERTAAYLISNNSILKNLSFRLHS